MTQRASIQKRGVVLPASVLLAAGLVLAILAMLGNGVPRAAAAPVAPSATTWYVNAATGSDGFTCQSPAAPCLTVGAAVTKAADGDAIVVAAGVYVEHLDVSKALTITGAGPALTFLDGGGSGRVLQTSGSMPKTLADLTIQHGRLTGSNDNGAAIRNLGTLRLQNVTVYSNTTNASGAIYNGGGRLTLENSRLLSNTVVGAGGAIYMYYNGHVTVTHSLLAGNRASQGGAIYSLANLYVADSTLRDNTAETFGGGLIVFGGTAVLERSTFTGNHADGNGGGIHNNLGVLTMTNTTLSRNSANNYPALSNVSANAHTWIRSSTIADNVATSAGTGYGLASFNGAFLTVQGTLFAANDDQNCLVSGTWTSAGHNLSSDNSCGLTAPGDLPLVDPLLAPLADYGGAAWTHALLPGSPAIDAGDNAACPAVDQRGVPRPFDGDGDGTAVCDIGAFEARSQLLVSDVTLAEGSAGTTQAVFTVTLAPTSTQPVTVAFATADDTAVAGSDYTAAAGVLTFSPGEALKQVPVDVLGDTEDEADETFLLNLGPAGGADVIDAQGVATIVDDDGLSSLTIADAQVNEGNSGTRQMGFVVTLSPPAAVPVTVTVATVDGTAAAGADYTAVNTSLTFAPGETMHTVNVGVLGDRIDEGASEAFGVQLSAPLNANLGDADAVGTIQDDDTAQLSIQVGPQVLEGGAGTTPAVFTVTLSTPTAFPVTVDYETYSATGGSGFAEPGVDYEPISGTLAFAAGETARTLTVLVYGDLDEEEDETFNMRLRNGSPVSIFGNTSTGWILNDDGMRVFLPLVVRAGQ